MPDVSPGNPPLASDDQRWAIFELFGHFGIREPEQIRADARSILRLEYLADAWRVLDDYLEERNERDSSGV
jgi:hypothetical protein